MEEVSGVHGKVLIIKSDWLRPQSQRSPRCVSASFTFDNNVLDGLMLGKAGVVSDSYILSKINVCGGCFLALTKENKVPRFALANGLYRGELPEQFRDLTWVDEKMEMHVSLSFVAFI